MFLIFYAICFFNNYPLSFALRDFYFYLIFIEIYQTVFVCFASSLKLTGDNWRNFSTIGGRTFNT